MRSIKLSREELNAMAFPVVVEGWEKKNYGRVKRAFMKEFSYYERNVIGQYYRRFYQWYLVKGTPETFTFRKTETFNLILRAIDFFGTI